MTTLKPILGFQTFGGDPLAPPRKLGVSKNFTIKSRQVWAQIAQPTEMVLYFLERPCPDNFKKYKIISVGGLWAEQFAIKNDRFYRENRKLRIYQNAKFAKSTKKLVNFDCELLGSQTTHRNGFVLFEIVRTRSF